MRNRFYFTLLIAFIIHPVLGQNSAVKLDDFFSQLSKNNQFNGNVLVAESGKVVYQRSFGYADLLTKIPNKKNTAFPVASITKTFTAVAILQLEEKGKLNTDSSVSRYLPEFPYPEIKVKNLLSHTSGLQPYDNFLESIRKERPDTIFSNNDVLKKYAELKLPLFYKPGETSNYDNVNYLFLALIIEKVSNQPYHQYIKKNILTPAGMNETFFPKNIFYNFPHSEKKYAADLYWYPHLYSGKLEKAGDNKFFASYWRSYNFQGFGEIVTTTNDLLKYDNALYDGKLLLAGSLKKAFTPVLLNDNKINQGNGNGSAFGLGWIVEINEPFGKVVRGSGGAIGLRASFLRDISKHQTIILIDNTQNETDDIAKDVLKMINGEDVKPYGKSAAKEYGKSLIEKDENKAKDILYRIKNKDAGYSINENEFNNLGYDFMNNGYDSYALETFKLNTELFPNGWNAFDSYGEALLKYGRKEEAIKMYRKSVELNPDNQNAKKIIEEQSK